MRGMLRNFELLGLPLLWGVAVYGAISLQNLAVADEHTICGPWGCGPATGALLAMHIGWLAVLGPPLLYLPGRIGLSPQAVRRLGGTLVTVGVLGVTSIVAWQWLVWLPNSGDWSRSYIWQRCGFAVAIAIDWPLVQLTLLGITLPISSRVWQRRVASDSAVVPQRELPQQLDRLAPESAEPKHSAV
ncbi:hypothetical protein [Aureliella helgolandensis]|uniref:Uncharacterized protein n=1 Tax=Aureliella helgolandensis TaxID=2527968 RepID=A0A518G487_9BACT|nr:hypothetical protein [Aureliella helgolandensis]QDV23395.1 hypothetical protein Q31a_16930 [Aureliella helgolandensis]